MRKITFLFAVFLFCSISQRIWAQYNGGIHYQAILRDNNGYIYKNMEVPVLFELSNAAAVFYAQTYTLHTNDFGLIDTVIGDYDTLCKILPNNPTTVSIKTTLFGNAVPSGQANVGIVPYAAKARDIAMDKLNGQTFYVNTVGSARMIDTTAALMISNNAPIPGNFDKNVVIRGNAYYNDTAHWSGNVLMSADDVGNMKWVQLHKDTLLVTNKSLNFQNLSVDQPLYSKFFPKRFNTTNITFTGNFLCSVYLVDSLIMNLSDNQRFVALKLYITNTSTNTLMGTVLLSPLEVMTWRNKMFVPVSFYKTIPIVGNLSKGVYKLDVKIGAYTTSGAIFPNNGLNIKINPDVTGAPSNSNCIIIKEGL